MNKKPKKTQEPPPTEKDNERAVMSEIWHKETEVLIIGTGVAGLFAAIEAHDMGAEVIVLDKASTHHASASWLAGSGGMAVADNRILEKAGIHQSPAELFDILMAYGKNASVPELLKVFVEKSGETLDKLLDMGLEEEPTFVYGGYKPKDGPVEAVRLKFQRDHPSVYVEVLMKATRERRIPLLFETRATRLIQAPGTKRVLGVKADTKEGVINIRSKKAVILATGGFYNNLELYDRYLTHIKGGMFEPSPQSTGEGLQMAQEIGADTVNMCAASTAATGVPIKTGARKSVHMGLLAPIAYGFVGGIYVNMLAKRFCRERGMLTYVGTEVLPNQPGKAFFYVLDDRMWTAWKALPQGSFGRASFPLAERGLEGTLTAKADTISELAARVRLDPNGLEKTIAEWNGCCDEGEDPKFEMDTLFEKIEIPPFYCVGPIYVKVVATLGGLRINSTCQVLDTYNNPMPGLFAAGEVAGGIHGVLYHGGSAISAALVFGRIAGENAARRLS